jgi:hypothetical protein
MRNVEQVVDRFMGYLGLFLIGALSWAADRLGPAGQAAPETGAQNAPRRKAAPDRAVRPGIPLATNQGS